MAVLVGLVLLCACVVPALAPARVALIATGTDELALLDVTTDRIVQRVALPAPGRAVAVTRDGTRGFVAADATVILLDLARTCSSARAATTRSSATSRTTSSTGAGR